MGSAASAREESEGGPGRNIAGPCVGGGFRVAMRVQGRWRRGLAVEEASCEVGKSAMESGMWPGYS